MTTDIADNAASESAEAIKVVQPENTMVSEEALRLAEALIFASTEPVSARRLAELLELRQLVPDGVDNLAVFVTSVLQALVQRYEGRGVMPVEIAGGWQFRTAPDLAPALTRVLERPRRFSRAVMETLAIIAYHQPCTRVQIEEIRGVSLGQNVLDTLIESALIMPKGRKEVPGRPVLWGTTQDFCVTSAYVLWLICRAGKNCWWKCRKTPGQWGAHKQKSHLQMMQKRLLSRQNTHPIYQARMHS